MNKLGSIHTRRKISILLDYQLTTKNIIKAKLIFFEHIRTGHPNGGMT